MAFNSPEEEWSARLKIQLDDRIALAVSENSLDKLKAALKDGADPSASNSKGLRLAAGMGQTDMVGVLLHAGADLSALDNAALRTAAKAGHTGVVSLLLGKGANANAGEGEALIDAASRGRRELVDILLSYGADPHADDDTALRKAAFAGDLPIVQSLVRHGADVFAMHGSALSLARVDKHEQVVEYLASEMAHRRDYLRETLDGMDEVAVDALRSPWVERDGRHTRETGLIRALKVNELAFALDTLEKHGGGLTFDDLYNTKDREGRSFVQLASERGQLKKIFDTARWDGRFDDMRKAWEKLPSAQRKEGAMNDDDFSHLLAEEEQKHLQAQASGFQLKPRPRKPSP